MEQQYLQQSWIVKCDLTQPLKNHITFSFSYSKKCGSIFFSIPNPLLLPPLFFLFAFCAHRMAGDCLGTGTAANTCWNKWDNLFFHLHLSTAVCLWKHSAHTKIKWPYGIHPSYLQNQISNDSGPVDVMAYSERKAWSVGIWWRKQDKHRVSRRSWVATQVPPNC